MGYIAMIPHRSETIQHILEEIGRGVDRGDRIATLIQIEDARRNEVITGRDADRLRAFLDALRNDARRRNRSA